MLIIIIIIPISFRRPVWADLQSGRIEYQGFESETGIETSTIVLSLSDGRKGLLLHHTTPAAAGGEMNVQAVGRGDVGD